MDIKSSIFTIGQWKKKKPAGTFEDTLEGIDRLAFLLEQKIDSAASGLGITGARQHLCNWVSTSKSILAAIFHGAEIVSNEMMHVNLHIIAKEEGGSSIMRVFEEAPASTASVFCMSVSDPGLLMDYVRRREPINWRAFFSGELVILGNDPASIGLTKELLQLVQERYERDAIADLRELISYDVWTTQFAQPKARHLDKVELDDNEFTDLAKKALEFRRVAKPLRKRLIPEVRKALGGT